MVEAVREEDLEEAADRGLEHFRRWDLLPVVDARAEIVEEGLAMVSGPVPSTLPTLVVVPVLHIHVFERSEAEQAMGGAARAQERE